MIERLLLSLVLLALSVVAYRIVRRWQAQRVQANYVPDEQPALLYFLSDHCAPCVTQSRLLQQLPEQVARQIRIEQIDAERERDRASSYGVFTLPTIMLLDRHGSVRHVNYGLTDARKLVRQVESVL